MYYPKLTRKWVDELTRKWVDELMRKWVWRGSMSQYFYGFG